MALSFKALKRPAAQLHLSRLINSFGHGSPSVSVFSDKGGRGVEAMRKRGRYTGRAALAAALLAAPMSAAAAEPLGTDTRLKLLWVDATGIPAFPWTTSRGQVESVLLGLGARVAWTSVSAGEPIPGAHDVEVIVVLAPPRLAPEPRLVMGYVPAQPGARTVRVYLDNVARVLGFPEALAASRRSEDRHDVARAVGTVISHEIVHLLTPGRPHASQGLMCEALNRGSLLSLRVPVDAETRAAARATLEHLRSRPPVGVAAGR